MVYFPPLLPVRAAFFVFGLLRNIGSGDIVLKVCGGLGNVMQQTKQLSPAGKTDFSGVFAGDSGRTEKVGFKALYRGRICANMCFYYFAANKDRPFFEYYSLKIAIICKKLSDFIIL